MRLLHSEIPFNLHHANLVSTARGTDKSPTTRSRYFEVPIWHFKKHLEFLSLRPTLT
jgi:hypothetical protein